MNLKIKLEEIKAIKTENARNANRNRIQTIETLDQIKQAELLEKQVKAYRERKIREFQAENRLRKQIQNQAKIAEKTRSQSQFIQEKIENERERNLQSAI